MLNKSNTYKENCLKVYIRTFGCQMNFYDSEVAVGVLENAGFKVYTEEDKIVFPRKRKSGSPLKTCGDDIVSPNLTGTVQHRKRDAPSTDREVFDKPVRPDIVLMNTCSVREHAEERVIGRLGALSKEKRKNSSLIIGLMGCMVEEHKEKLFKRFPQLDIIVGTRNIMDLPRLIQDVLKSRKQKSIVEREGISIKYTDLIKRRSKYHAWLPIMTGCNKRCTYCIVPFTRGSEVSMTANEVYKEAERLVNDGVKRITLLGQNVNSYGKTTASLREGEGADEVISEIAAFTPLARNDSKNVTFPQLLEMLCKIEGLERLSFSTSHPQDATRELFSVIRDNPKISRRFHLPIQSGSDKILRRMKRFHTYKEFKEKIDLLRKLVPGISVTTDIIVGFSGETKEEYLKTKKALEEIRFDGAFIYKYSLRPGTPAARLPDDVLLEEKVERNKELLEVQKKITKENSEKMIGKTIRVFVDGINTKDTRELVAFSDQDFKILFSGKKDCAGKFVEIKIEKMKNSAFLGNLVCRG